MSVGQRPISPKGERLRDRSVARVSLDLTERVGPAQWRALTAKPAMFAAGDRIRFGNPSNAVCLLGTLNAVVVEARPDALYLEFEFYGAVLDQMIAVVATAPR